MPEDAEERFALGLCFQYPHLKIMKNCDICICQGKCTTMPIPEATATSKWLHGLTLIQFVDVPCRN
jgi:hypothetical protein